MVKKIAFVLLAFFTGISFATPIKKVGIAIDVNDVSEIYPKQELTDLELTIHLRWNSENKAAEPQFFQGDQVAQKLSDIWWPYYQIINSRGVINSKFRAMQITPDGVVNYTEQFRVQIETAMDMHNFPFDHQVFKILVSPFGQSKYQEQYYPLNDHVKINSNAHLDEWDLKAVADKISVNGNTPFYQVSLDYQRKSGFYLYKVIFPLLVIFSIANLILWLPRQPAINRLSVIMTAMLTVVAFQWAINGDMPTVSYITFLQAILLFTFLLVGSMALLIVVDELTTNGDNEKLMYHARWLYPFGMIVGLLAIALLWFG